MKSSIPIKLWCVGCLCLIFLASGCREDTRELPTRGNLTLISSEDIFLVLDEQVKEFQRLYAQTHIVHLSSTTREAIVQLLNDSVKVIACARDLNDEEKSVIKNNNLEVEKFKVAYDCIAVLVNESNGLKKITISQLRDILLGKTKTWRGIPSATSGGSIAVAMGGPNSGVYEYLKKRITDGATFGPVLYPCSTTTHVISFVQQHSNAIGFVGMSWVLSTPAKTRILDIGDPAFKRDSTDTALEYFSPAQAHVYRNYYPLRRTLYLYGKGMGGGVGRGFTAFVMSGPGQKLFLTNGIVPATMPVKLVQLNTQ